MCFAFLANACLVRQLLLYCAFHLYPRHARALQLGYTL